MYIFPFFFKEFQNMLKEYHNMLKQFYVKLCSLYVNFKNKIQHLLK